MCIYGEGDSVQHLVIIDGLSFFFRAYHAVSNRLTRSDGLPTNALYGFSQMLIKVVKDLQPDLCLVALDSIGPTFRKDMYPEYKANRAELDEEMALQLPYFELLIAAFGLPGIRVEGVEADDIIATLATRYGVENKVTIVSSDKDLLQLLDEAGQVRMLDTMKNKTFGPAEVMEKFGVGPDKVIEVQALIGDSSDNVPGVRGIGPKTAAQLIQQFETIENLYNNLDQVEREKLRESLKNYEKEARISRKLVELKQDVEFPLTEEELAFNPDLTGAAEYLKNELEFKTLADRLPAGVAAVKKDEKAQKTVNFAEKTPQMSEKGEKSAEGAQKYQTVTTQAAFKEWIERIQQAGVVAIDTETTSLDALQAKLVGISLAVKAGAGCYVPLAHVQKNEGELDFGGNDEKIEQLDKNWVKEQLKPILLDKSIVKVGHNLKYDLHILHGEGLDIPHLEDTMLMSFCLDGGKHGHNMDLLALKHLGHQTIAFKDVAGTGKSQITFDQVPLEQATPYAAEDADITLQLYEFFKKRLDAAGMEPVKKLYEKVERALVPTLARMEEQGILVDKAELSKLSQEFETRLRAHEAEIFKLAGTEFNVNSPKQLGEVLFDQMGLQAGKKKTRSTNVEIMEILAADGHTIAAEVLAYRQVAKLRSTYTEALIGQINPKTGRVHTSYHQAGAATGRFSSSDPNLQNIPIRSEDGRKIRRAFITQPGWQLLGADYSQIELRLLAHMSDSKPLQEAFIQGQDIHTHTAHQLLGIPHAEVTTDQRRVAKIINFGIVYGMGAVSLAKQAHLTREEAKQYIEQYFERYAGVREYMEYNKEQARANGYVTTLLGRRVHLPEIDSNHPGLKAGAERAAINAPLQGSNADIIKLVMPRIEQALQEQSLQTRMLLQVHDELVFEVPEAEMETAKPLILDLMENVVSLKVPLKVGSGVGANWEDAH